MLDKKRITDAENNLRTYLADKLIQKTDVDQNILDIFIKNATESLKLAQITFDEERSDLWTVVISYYTMFYIANAVLYKKGYKVGDKIAHKITSDALIVFVRNSLEKSLLVDFEDLQAQAQANMKAGEMLDSFEFERKKRGLFQYNMQSDLKRSKANTSLERAKEFLFEMKELL